MKVRTTLIACVLLTGSIACASNDDGDTNGDAAEMAGMSMSLGDVESSVEGNTVLIPVDIEGFDIVAADGDTSGDTGHFHVFVDREPVEVGETMPVERGIVHSPDNPILVVGLEPGEHELTVVVGDGTHKRVHGDLEESVTVDVEGPSVLGGAPATIEEGDDLQVQLSSEGVDIVAADGDTSGETGHYHVLVDPSKPPQAGDTIPEAEEGSIYHTAESSVTIEGLEPGPHVIWVVLGDGAHEAFDPPVLDKLMVTVE